MIGLGPHLTQRIIRRRLGGKRAFKLTWILTEVCHHRCEICRLWESPQKGPSLHEVEQFMRANPNIPWINLSGGELFARKDIKEVLDVILCHQKGLDWLSFPTAGFIPVETEGLIRFILNHKRSPRRLAVTISIDGHRTLHDRLRGRLGAYDRAVESWKRVSSIGHPRLTLKVGLTLSRLNVGEIDESLTQMENDLNDWSRRDLHLNIAHHSPHYYKNAPDVRAEADEMIAVLDRLDLDKTKTAGRAESLYRLLARTYVRTGQMPLPCQALSSSVFVGPDMRVFPCSTWDRPLGSLKDHQFRLDSLLSQENSDTVRQEIKSERCPGCWTPCDALPTIVTQPFRAVWRARKAQREFRR